MTLWATDHPAPGQGETIPIGRFGIWGEGGNISLIRYGNGCFLSRQAAEILRSDYGVNLRIIVFALVGTDGSTGTDPSHLSLSDGIDC